MSHDATNWAIKQRGLKPATKIVLWHLADRHNPDYGCFPRQDTLAADAEVSRSSLNDHLAILEARGLIRRVARIDPKTKRQLSTRYILACEPDVAQDDVKPCPEFGHGMETEQGADPCPEFGHGAVSEKTPEPFPKNAESRVRNSDTNPVREPLREPVRRASARRGRGSGSSSDTQPSDSAPPDHPDWSEAFDRFWAAFPDPVERDAARKAFDGVLEAGEIGPDELVEIATTYARSRHVERGYGMKPANWLARGSWRDEWEASKAAKAAAPPVVDMDAVAQRWVEPVKAGRTYAASSIKPAVARHMLSLGLVTESELRRAGVTL